MSSEEVPPISSVQKVRNLPNSPGDTYEGFTKTKEEKVWGSPTEKKILFVFATFLEAQSFPASKHILIIGMGPEEVRRNLTASAFVGYDEVWNIGFAGAVDKKLPFGSIHTVSRVGRHEQDGDRELHPEGKRLITFDAPLHDPVLRDLLAHQWDLVDMEGGVIAEIAMDNNIPCHLIKIVSDNADENTTASILDNAPLLSNLLKDYVDERLSGS